LDVGIRVSSGNKSKAFVNSATLAEKTNFVPKT